MKRRALLLATAALTVAGTSARTLAQPKRGPVVIGWLSIGSTTSGQALAAFKEGLAELGWKEPAQVVIEARWADGRLDRLPALAEQLAAKKPAVIVATSAQTAVALAKAAPNTPIVQATGTNPVETGLAASLARPGGMVTGLTNLATELSEKLLELLVTIAPKVKRVGFLIAPTSRKDAQAGQLDAARRSAARYAVEAHFAHPSEAEDLKRAIDTFAKHGVQSLIVMPSPFFVAERARILELASAQRWPLVSSGRQWAEHGALLSYGVDNVANFRRAAYYVDRILKGAKPGDLPIELPTKFELVLNAKAAKTFGLTIPQELLLRANQVIA